MLTDSVTLLERAVIEGGVSDWAKFAAITNISECLIGIYKTKAFKEAASSGALDNFYVAVGRTKKLPDSQSHYRLHCKAVLAYIRSESVASSASGTLGPRSSASDTDILARGSADTLPGGLSYSDLFLLGFAKQDFEDSKAGKPYVTQSRSLGEL